MKNIPLLGEVMANDYKEKIVHMLGTSAYWYELAVKNESFRNYPLWGS